jgi:hypothetical protein
VIVFILSFLNPDFTCHVTFRMIVRHFEAPHKSEHDDPYGSTTV